MMLRAQALRYSGLCDPDQWSISNQSSAAWKNQNDHVSGTQLTADDHGEKKRAREKQRSGFLPPDTWLFPALDLKNKFSQKQPSLTRVRSMPILSWDRRWMMMLLCSSWTPSSSSSLSSVSVVSSLGSAVSGLLLWLCWCPCRRRETQISGSGDRRERCCPRV